MALYQASSRAGVCMNMMKFASTVGYLLHLVMPTVCDVAPSLPAYGPLPNVGIAIRPTLLTPTCLTKPGTAVPAETVIAALPWTNACCPW